MCDFGSATTQRPSPDYTRSATQRGLTEDEVRERRREGAREGERRIFYVVLLSLFLVYRFSVTLLHCTLYRVPEMIDLYSNNPINKKADIGLVVITYMYTCTCTSYGKCMNILENLWLYLHVHVFALCMT